MAGRNRAWVVLILLSISIGCLAGFFHYSENTIEQIRTSSYESTELSHSPMNGLTNNNTATVRYEFMIVGENISIYVLSPEEYRKVDSSFTYGSFTYDPALTQLNVTNRTALIELPSRYSIIFYSGDSGVNISEIQRSVVTPPIEEPLVVGAMITSIGIIISYIFLEN